MTSNRNYVAAWTDKRTDSIIVIERDDEGKKFHRRLNAPYYFYVPDDNGEFTSIDGDKLKRLEFGSRDDFESATRQFPHRFESDIRPLNRVLMDEYYDRPTPPMTFAFFDIEVNYSQKLGFAGPTNPYAIINAVTVYQSWTKKHITIAVPPLVPNPNGSGSIRWTEIPGNDANKILAKISDLTTQKLLRDGIIPEIKLVDNEYELVIEMLAALENADIISGWNSEFYDIPYICKRLKLIGGEPLLARIEHRGAPLPWEKMVDHYGNQEPIFKFTGKAHLDYMKLFQKFTFEGRVSYALGNILQEEVGVGKLDFDGTLEELYHSDFETFVAYNFRDTDGLVQLDDKFKFIALANQMAHENTVLLEAVLGTVAYVETGITNHAHYKLGKIVRDKHMSEHEKVEGAIVMTPRIGLHEWIGSVDINSLYPNIIRSLNISPEKIIGQFTAKEEAWRDIWEGNENKHCLQLETGGEGFITTASLWKKFLKDNKYAVSAYGTVFDQGNGRGVVVDILGFWYSERKRLQAEKKKYGKLAKEEQDPIKKKEYQKLEEQYDLLQLTKKISMNSLYGALLNIAFRFGDERMGASVTGSGRATTTHMIETIGYFLTGTKDELVKTSVWDDDEQKFTHEYSIPNPSIIYGDTDSCYYLCMGATNKEEAIEIADLAANYANDSFPAFMQDAFNCQPEFDNLIKAGREIVGRRGLFQAKKKYMIKVVDMEGQAVDKMKSMGSEIKKADTPKIIQKFLKNTVDLILDGKDYDSIATYVNEQRRNILKKKDNVFLLGVAKQVNNLEKFRAAHEAPGTIKNQAGKNLTVPGHVSAALNYNSLLQVFDKGAKEIRSGDKVLIFYLKPNAHGMKAIGVPADMSSFPEWFIENFSVDIKKTEERMFDSKLSGIFSALGFDVPTPQSVFVSKVLEF